MTSDNIYYEVLDYDGSEERNWFSYAWRSIKQDDFDDVESLLEELDSRKDELGDLEISLLSRIYRSNDNSDLSDYTVSLAKEYGIEESGPTNSFA